MPCSLPLQATFFGAIKSFNDSLFLFQLFTVIGGSGDGCARVQPAFYQKDSESDCGCGVDENENDSDDVHENVSF